MKVCVISANLGSYDPPHPWAEQILPDDVECEIHRLTDENFPPRPLAMTSRLQCGIPKWFGHELFPGFDLYLWVDASCALTRGNEVDLWVKTIGDADIAIFKHPDRKNVVEEYGFIKDKLEQGNKYLKSRYEGEWLDEQFEFISNHGGSAYAPLYASTAFIYRPTIRVKHAFKETAFLKFRFHLHDQLALAYALRLHDVSVRVINQNYQKSGYMEYVRNKK